jgi:hypothetical protein
MALQPAESAFGSEQARHAPPLPHVTVAPQHHPRRHTPPTFSVDSIGLVVARLRRSASGTPSLITVSVSSNPSRRLAAGSGLTRASQVAVPLKLAIGCLVVILLVHHRETSLQLRPVLFGHVCLDVMRNVQNTLNPALSEGVDHLE